MTLASGILLRKTNNWSKQEELQNQKEKKKEKKVIMIMYPNPN